MKPLRHNLAEILTTLKEIENSDAFQANVKHQAGSIANKINFCFVCCVCVWYDMLNQRIAINQIKCTDGCKVYRKLERFFTKLQ